MIERRPKRNSREATVGDELGHAGQEQQLRPEAVDNDIALKRAWLPADRSRRNQRRRLESRLDPVTNKATADAGEEIVLGRLVVAVLNAFRLYLRPDMEGDGSDHRAGHATWRRRAPWTIARATPYERRRCTPRPDRCSPQ
jgi:hypothetical protein